MELLSIKTSRFPTRVYLKFSTGLFIPFYIDDVVKMSLSSGKHIDDSEFAKIVERALNYLSWEYALKQIAISPKTEKILSQKINGYLNRVLYKYQIPNIVDTNKILNQCILKVKEQGLINDFEYIIFFIKKNSKKSKKEIIFLLAQKGININELPQDVFNKNDDLEKIKKLIEKKGTNREKLANFEYKNKLTAYLYRKGFSLSNIKTAIDEFLNSR